MGVMFPAFAAALMHDRNRAAQLYGRTVNYIFLALFPIVLIIITFAYEGLDLWIGSDFANNSYLVLQLLAIGVFLNSLANVPFGLIQSAGRPDLTAKLHIVELPFYLLILWWLLSEYGIVGVAVAWVLRVAVDSFILLAGAVICQAKDDAKIDPYDGAKTAMPVHAKEFWKLDAERFIDSSNLDYWIKLSLMPGTEINPDYIRKKIKEEVAYDKKIKARIKKIRRTNQLFD